MLYINKVLIFLAIMIMVGNNYAFDIPQALEVPIERSFHLTQTQFNLMYSVFAIPNIGLSIGGGMMIDQMGGRWGIFTFSFMLALSQLLIVSGGCYHSYYMMLVGRAIFGIASDMLHIAVFKLIAKRMPDQLGTSMGLILTLPELAAALNSYLSPVLFQETHSIKVPLLFGLSLCVLSFFCALIMIFIDIKNKCDGDEEEEILITEFQFNRRFVYMVLICTFILGAYVPFLDNANKFYQERFGFTSTNSGLVITICYIVAAFSSPIVGKISDTFKHKQSQLIIGATLIFLLSHGLLFMLGGGHPNYYSIIALFTLGLGYSCYSAILIPALQQTVTEQYLATALGIMGVVENIIMAVIPMISGYIYSMKHSMKDVDLIYIILSTCGVLMSFQIAQIQKQKLK